MDTNQGLLPFTGEELRNGGIQVALDSAEIRQIGWKEQAYSVLEGYIKSHMGEFMCEHVRKYAKEISDLSDPPSERAWGGIFLKASRKKLIRFVRHQKVTNPKAHCAFASVWIAA